MNKCRFCGIELHWREDGKGWEENDEPNCPMNPSRPRYGHSKDSGIEKLMKGY